MIELSIFGEAWFFCVLNIEELIRRYGGYADGASYDGGEVWTPRKY